MAKNILEDIEQFDKIMSEIDGKLAKSGRAIYQRPLAALSVVSKKFSIPLPMSPPLPGMPEELLRNWPISQRIRKWWNKWGQLPFIAFLIFTCLSSHAFGRGPPLAD
ncbi:MAG: hypothetical protein ABII09_00165 [Planctomycetota bacterium]